MSDKSPWADLARNFGNTLGSLAELAEKLSEAKARGEIKVERKVRARTVDGGDLDDLKDLASRLRTVVNPAPAPAQADAPARPLTVEVHDEADKVVVLVKEPSLQAGRLRIHVDGDMLELDAVDGDVSFHGEAHLPCIVDDRQRSMRGSLGLIELSWPKPEDARPKPKLRKRKA
ncbi:MAG: hypothetical protein MUE46_04575 [Xanthomonadales bacterium]|jgi:HSP20 family molecular chaperone IbpA|nr:hypothetical protein [Xanthomonadales bacterium]